MTCCGHFEFPFADCLCRDPGCWCAAARELPFDLDVAVVVPLGVEPTDLDNLMEGKS